MKKTLAIITVAMLSLQVEASSVILTFANADTGPLFSTDNWKLNNVGKGQGGGIWNDTTKLTDGTSITVEISNGKLWNYSQTDAPTWTNETVLEDINSTLGTSLTAVQMQGLTYVASGAGGATTTLTLNLTGNTAYKVGDSVTFFISAGRSTQDQTDPLTKFSVSGLTGPSIEWAAPGGSGYGTGDFSFTAGTLGFFKITGTLTSDAVVFTSTEGKNGFGLVAYTVVPEPATATLSLLALAGLCVRRRRR